MKEYLKNELGYVFYIVLSLVIIFSIIGLSLLTLTTNGIGKNTIRQDTTLAQDLSNKGINFFQSEIDTSFKQQIGRGLTIIEFEGLLKDMLENPAKSKYLCPKTLSITGELGVTKVCIEKSEPYSNKEEDKLKRLITVKSEGISADTKKSHVIYSKIVVGASSVPEQLNYAISTNADQNGKGGNLFLYGGIDITGDIKTDGNFLINKNAFSGWLYNPSWKTSTYPMLTATEGNSYPKIIVNSNKSIFDMTGKITGSSFESFIYNANYTNYKSILNEYKVNTISTEQQTSIQKLFKDYNKNEKNKPRIIVQEVEKDILDIAKEVNKTGKQTIGDPKYNSKGEITGYYDTFSILGSRNSTAKYGEPGKKYYIKGDLLIGRYAGTETLDNNQANYYNIILEGEYYVEGAIDIKGAKLQGNSKFYSMKDIDITSSTISGYKNGTNFFFADDFINISNISADSAINNPSIIDGFFYTKGPLLMYGFGSNIKIFGGISANRIVLTALRGKANEGDLTSESRLRIVYDLDMINKFLQNRDDNTILITSSIEPRVLEMSQTPFK